MANYNEESLAMGDTMCERINANSSSRDALSQTVCLGVLGSQSCNLNGLLEQLCARVTVLSYTELKRGIKHAHVIEQPYRVLYQDGVTRDVNVRVVSTSRLHDQRFVLDGSLANAPAMLQLCDFALLVVSERSPESVHEMESFLSHSSDGRRALFLKCTLIVMRDGAETSAETAEDARRLAHRFRIKLVTLDLSASDPSSLRGHMEVLLGNMVQCQWSKPSIVPPDNPAIRVAPETNPDTLNLCVLNVGFLGINNKQIQKYIEHLRAVEDKAWNLPRPCGQPFISPKFPRVHLIDIEQKAPSRIIIKQFNTIICTFSSYETGTWVYLKERIENLKAVSTKEEFLRHLVIMEMRERKLGTAMADPFNYADRHNIAYFSVNVKKPNVVLTDSFRTIVHQQRIIHLELDKEDERIVRHGTFIRRAPHRTDARIEEDMLDEFLTDAKLTVPQITYCTNLPGGGTGNFRLRHREISLFKPAVYIGEAGDSIPSDAPRPYAAIEERRLSYSWDVESSMSTLTTLTSVTDIRSKKSRRKREAIEKRIGKLYKRLSAEVRNERCISSETQAWDEQYQELSSDPTIRVSDNTDLTVPSSPSSESECRTVISAEKKMAQPNELTSGLEEFVGGFHGVLTCKTSDRVVKEGQRVAQQRPPPVLQALTLVSDSCVFCLQLIAALDTQWLMTSAESAQPNSPAIKRRTVENHTWRL